MTTVAVMQPYFVPYAGYFRLFAAADVFVVFDCVQFPRRGWVHRNRFLSGQGEMDWLTLPIEKCPRDTRIDQLRFAADARRSLTRGMQRFPLLQSALADPVLSELLADIGTGTVADYLCVQMARLTALVGVSKPMVRSSTLSLAPELRGQERVLAIVQRLGGTRYVNSPGGRDLYQPEAFAAQGIELEFLAPYAGSLDSILTSLLTTPVERIKASILAETAPEYRPATQAGVIKDTMRST